MFVIWKTVVSGAETGRGRIKQAVVEHESFKIRQAIMEHAIYDDLKMRETTGEVLSAQELSFMKGHGKKMKALGLVCDKNGNFYQQSKIRPQQMTQQHLGGGR